jgi:putative peptide zinc metalloprotease protein
MATLAESFVSSTSRPVKLRMRPDLTARKQRYHGQTFWVVKEPIGLNYFRFHEEEFSILNMLDGRTSLDQIKEEFEAEYTPQKVTFGDLQQFIGMLHRNGLVISEASGQGKQLRRRRDEKKWRELMGMLANVFALRFRGVDPERFLTWLYKYTGWFFRWYTVIAVMLFALSALTLVMVQYDTFSARLPTFHQFFGPKNWIYLAIVMGAVKVLHEFGHGLSCKHFGGECHELGAMLLVFTPALYCNVSDSWMLPNKYHRAAIGAAGMYVELFLASIATYVWWFSTNGTLLNQLALSVMFICSVSTVMFNGNPLLRFDGYYILMDLSEIPNLRQKSTEVLRRFMLELCLGLEQPESPFLPQRNRLLFGTYTVAAEIYRLVVVFSILFFLNKVFEPYGLKIIGQAIGFAGVVGLIFQPLYQLFQFFYVPGRMNKVKKNRVWVTLSVVGVALLAVIFIPLPYSVHCTFEMVPEEAGNVVVSTPGMLTESPRVKPGQWVKAGDVIAELSNPDLEAQLVERKGEWLKAQEKLVGIRRVSFEDAAYAPQIPPAREMLATAEELYQSKKEEADKLVLRAPRDGMVLPPPYKPDDRKKSKQEGKLPSWSGSPFDAANAGAMLQRSELFCRVGDPKRMEANLVIDQADIDLVREHHEVRLLPKSYVQRAYSGTIKRIARIDVRQLPGNLASNTGGDVDAKVDPASGTARPLSTSYHAMVPLENDDNALAVGTSGTARIYTGWQSIGERLYRYVVRTFHFHL